jgi:hypothetical protein
MRQFAVSAVDLQRVSMQTACHAGVEVRVESGETRSLCSALGARLARRIATSVAGGRFGGGGDLVGIAFPAAGNDEGEEGGT